MTGHEVRPLSIRPEVMNAIRPMRPADAPRVAQLHRAAMGHSLWARLGQAFLATLYRRLIPNPLFVGFVYEEAGSIGGFIAGSTNTAAMFRQVFRKHFLPLAARTAVGVAMDPRVIPLLLRTSTYFDASGSDIPAESLFCSFLPELRGKKIADHINKVLFDELLYRGHKFVKITTESDNRGANRQLTHWGFQVGGRFRFYGKDMVKYVLDLEESHRVEPVGRYHQA